MTLDESLDTKQLRAELADALHDQWAFYLTEGILLLVLGLLAILVPQVATLSVTIVIGAAFFAGGVAGLVSTFTGRRAPGFWWSLASAVLAIVVGFLLLVQPISGAISLTFVLIAFFAIEGIVSILFGLEQRRYVSTWGWMVASGVVDLALASHSVDGHSRRRRMGARPPGGNQFDLRRRRAHSDRSSHPHTNRPVIL